jgi:hypothetical protein
VLNDGEYVPMLVPPIILFMVGVGMMINGLWFTIPRKQFPEPDLSLQPEPFEVPQRQITQNITPAYPPLTNSSVTEHTTHHLRDKDVR